jgi:hypothetical protein
MLNDVLSVRISAWTHLFSCLGKDAQRAEPLRSLTSFCLVQSPG